MSSNSQVRATTERTAGVALTEFSVKRRGPVRRFFYRHPVVMDLCIVLIYLLVASPNTLLSSVADKSAPIALVLVTAGVLFFRRRYPIPVVLALAVLEMVAVVLADPISNSVGTSLVFGLYVVAATRGGRFGFAITAAVTLPLVAFMVVLLPTRATPASVPLGQVPTFWVVTAGFIILANVVATGIGVSVRRDRMHEKELQEWARRNAALASANERNRIAREMHDVVAHSLSVMIALSDGAQVAFKRSPDRAEEALAKLSQTGRSALADMQRVLGLLRAEGSQEQGERKPLPADFDIEALLAGFRAAGMPLSFSLSGPTLPEDPAFRLTVYRIMQESLTNVLRYARSVSRVEVKLTHEHPQVLLSISDDGKQAIEDRRGPLVIGSGKGLIGMRERAASYAGQVSAGPAANGGWLVEANLQCPDSTEAGA
ncbi:signal transduction histidine kinase [Psychromicrobium silvestre]|uniref:histidine kinase n=1 Tax=Psychromicrobium silvestre TaxID=1645614 RepID=A0A7Y9LUP5_9MICC|nr:histidine kinase [Psychromicrobium silvestre]NYE95963.1 signal transduction histidine kinase [Psychromicrobium silvestre]